MIAGHARRAVRGLARRVDGIARADGISVLIYHQVGGATGRSVDLDVDEFARQIEWLAEHHRVLSLDVAVDELLDPTLQRRPGVVVTIDDGTADVTDLMVPVLVEHRVPATLYVATQFVADQVEFPWGARPTSWSALRDAMSTGLLSIGCHTHTHPVMHRMDAPTAAAELDTSIRLLQHHLGVTAAHFAYPRAVAPSSAAAAEVRGRFRSAALAGGGANRVGACDPYRLHRTPVQRDDASRFASLATGGGRLDGAVRAGVTALNHRRAS